jgi:hypothetical protein
VTEKNEQMKQLLTLLFSLFVCLTADAQQAVRGVVEDSTTHERLAGVSVQLLRAGKPVQFVRTDGDGKFTFTVQNRTNDDELQATAMGYRKKKTPISSASPTTISMAAEAFALKEVQVRGGRIFGRQDTLTYDLTRFANGRDNTLKDVLKKLPGVDVDKSGQINYNGKAINRFTVEGLDLTGGRYNQLEENIKAKDVKKAEIIEHDQPVKALQNKVFTDQVAMNIGLKDEARDKLMPTLRPYLLVGEPTSVGGSATIMQIGKRRQWMYDLGYDRTGEDLSRSFSMLAFYGGRLSTASLPEWLTVPSLAAPIDAERLRFNTSQKYAVSRVQQSKNGDEFRLSAHYLRSVVRQHTENASTYYLGDTGVKTTAQNEYLTLLSDAFSAEMEHKVNTAKAYGNEVVKVEASQADGLSLLGDSLRQRVRVPKVDLSANLYRLFTLAGSQLSVRTVADYHYSVSDLYVNDLRNRIRTSLWHAGSSVGWMQKKKWITQEYTAGVDVRNLHPALSTADSTLLGSGRAVSTTLLSASLTPYWQYERETFTASLTPRVTWERYTAQQRSFLLLCPSYYLTLKVGHRSEWSLYGGYAENTGDMNLFALYRYRQNYRTYYSDSGLVPETRSLSSSLSYHYKRPIEELFFNATLSGNRLWMNTVTDMVIDGGRYFYTLRRRDSHANELNAEASVSKGFYALHLKTRLGAAYDYAKGEQYTADNRVDYTLRTYTLSPNIEFSPSWGALSYQGNFSWSHSATGAGQADGAASSRGVLFGWKQTLSATSTIGNFDLTCSLVHYRNELQQGHTLNTLLADAVAVWRHQKVRLQAKLSNLFNKRQYVVTQYSGVALFTDRYTLRGREMLFSLQYTL